MQHAIELLRKLSDEQEAENFNTYNADELEAVINEANGIDFDAGFQYGLDYALRMLKEG